MKSIATLLLFGLIALAQDNPRVLEGSVVNSVTGAGIDGAQISLIGKGKGGRKQSVTDATGNFHISGLTPGDYSVVVQKTGFFFAPPSVYPNVGASLHIASESDPPHLRLELIPPAILRGHVFAMDGKPAAKVQVALGPEYEKKTVTDGDGAFVFENVHPGQASLAAFDGHVRTYFPATTDSGVAEPISVRPGEDQGGYEIRLQPASVYRVRGVVLDAAGKPSANSIVRLSPVQPSVGGPQVMPVPGGSTAVFSLSQPARVQSAREPDAVSGNDGAFEFPSVREGDWVLHAEAENIDRGVAFVSVRKDLDDVRIRVDGAIEILGTVVLSDGSPAPRTAVINVMLTSTEGLRGGSGNTDKTGSVRIEDVDPGHHRVIAIARSPGYYVASVMVGDVDAMRQPALLSDSSPPLRIILKAGGTLSGNVDKGEGAKLLLVPQTVAPGDGVALYPCGAGGNFQLTGIPPGNYYAIAVTQLEPPFQSLIDSVRAVMRDATPVRVEEGAVTSVQLKAPVELR
jgi:Carboxypeptidase regulatory-like domain